MISKLMFLEMIEKNLFGTDWKEAHGARCKYMKGLGCSFGVALGSLIYPR
jgi:hypothetical protein